MGFRIIDITANNVLSFEPYIKDSDLARVQDKDVVLKGLLNENGNSCGVLLARINEDENSIFVESICVDGTLRRQGGGTLLMQSIMEIAEERKSTLVCRLLPPELMAQQTFFMFCGITEFEPGEWFYNISKEDLKEYLKSETGSRLAGMAKKSGIKAEKMIKSDRAFKNNHADIDYDGTLSYAIEGNPEKGAILAADTGDGSGDIMIQELCIAEGNAVNKAVLLITAFVNYYKEMKDGARLYIKALSDKEKNLWEGLIGDIEFEYVLYGQKSYIDEDMSVELKRTLMALPRLNSLGDFLENADYSYTLIMDTESGSSIDLEREDGMRPVGVGVTLLGGSEAESFQTEIYSSFTYDSLTDEEREAIKKWKNESDLVSIVISDESNREAGP